MKENIVGNILLKIFGCVFAIMTGYIVYINIFSNYGRLFPMNRIIVMAGGIFIVALMLVLVKVFKYLQNRTLIIISFISLGIIILLQSIFIIYCKVEPSWDFGVIFNDAYNIANSVFELPEYYYKYYPNNLGVLILYVIIFRIVNIFTTDKSIYLLVGSLFNMFMINASIITMYMLVKKVFNLKFATLFSILSCLILPLYSYAPIFYTDTITMVFPVLMLLFLVNYIKGKRRGNILYLFGIGIVAAVGVILKTNIIIPLVAIIIYILCRNKFIKGIIINMLIIVAFLGVFSAYKMAANYVMPIDYNDSGLPMVHWVMMGLKNNGGFNREDVDFTSSFENREEAQKADIEVIKERLSNYGFKGYIEFINRKIKFTWNDGTYYSINKLSRQPIDSTSKVEKYVIGDKNHGLIYFAQMSHLALIIMLFISSLTVFKRKYSLLQISQIAIFGVFLFLIIWETRSRYLVCILPLMLFTAIGGLYYLCERSKNEVHK